MHSYEFLDHTADLYLRARADSLAELLTACGEAMFGVLVEGGKVAETTSIEVELEAEDAEDLVHAWLRELLFRFDAEHLVLCRFNVHEATPTGLRATCLGEPFDPARHQGGTEIKAVTYHGFSVAHTPDGWVAEVLFDI